MSEVTTDHDTIKKWAEKHGGQPAAVDRTHEGGDVGIIRIMFPKNKQSDHGSLVPISWDEFFKQFDESKLALLYSEDSMFSKLIGRDTAEKRAHGDNDASRHENRRYKGGSEPDDGGSKRSSASSRGGGSSRSEGRGSSGSDSDEERSLKEREYRDADGNVHHHTNKYMEEHGSGQ